MLSACVLALAALPAAAVASGFAAADGSPFTTAVSPRGVTFAGFDGADELDLSNSRGVRESDRPRIASAYGRLPLSFEENRGQVDRRVRFVARGGGVSAGLTERGALVALYRSTAAAPAAGVASRRGPAVSRTSLALWVGFVGEATGVRLIGGRRLAGRVNYLIGKNRRGWHTNVPTFSSAVYRRVWRGIDASFRGDGRSLEYVFSVAPGADPRQIVLVYRGQSGLRLDSGGNLLLGAGAGRAVRQLAPRAYQLVGGRRHPVASRYVLSGRRVAIRLGAYDHQRALVIDPTLAYSTYLGGTSFDQGVGVTVDSSGNAYVSGTAETAFPTTAGAWQTVNAGSDDAFVAKLNASGTALVYSTYLGGSSTELARGIAVDPAGDAYIAGDTHSSDFPTTAGAPQAAYGGNNDAFVAKLNASGSGLVYATYLGGAGAETIGGIAGASSLLEGGIAVDPAGSAYVAGDTTSTDFPTTAGAFQTVKGSQNDAFVSKLNAGGTGLVYSTYLGGANQDFATGVAVDSADAYVTGVTSSTNFPTTAGAFRTAYGGGSRDAFVTALNSSGSAPIYSTYLGGTGSDTPAGIAVDGSRSAYVTGTTFSPDFPITAGALRTVYAGSSEVFVSKLFAGGGGLYYSTYLGGAATNEAGGIAVGSGTAYVTGDTSSTDFPTTPAAPRATNAGGYDAFVSQLDVGGGALVYSTYLGGASDDIGTAIAVDAAGGAYITGDTLSTGFPTTAGAPQTTNAGSYDAFISKLTGTKPVNTALPQTSGKATAGQVLSTTDGAWTGNPTFAYQWRDCDTAGNNCGDVAANGNAKTYTLTGGDVGKTIRVVVTATNPGGSTAATSDKTATVAPPPPSNTALPQVSGPAIAGRVLSTTDGSWTGSPTFAYQWRGCDTAGNNCANVAVNGNAKTYTLAGADLGKTIRVVVTATNPGGSTAATSDKTGTVAPPPPPSSTAVPQISGPAIAGRVLSTTDGSWTGSPTFAYQWRDCDAAGNHCSNVSVNGSAKTYTPTAADVGKTIRVVVTATNAGGSASAISDKTATVAPPPPPPLNLTSPLVYWSAYRDSFVCNPGSWQNVTPNPTYGYEWLRISAGSGHRRVTITTVATTRYYNPPSESPNSFVCRVTASNPVGSTVASSDATQLHATTVPIQAFGNFRIRGIDVFQVVQPNSCAPMFGYPTGAFPCLSGGGTPTPYGSSGTLAAGEDPQRGRYVGVRIDSGKPTTAVVYVDSTEAVSSPSQRLEVTLMALYNGDQIGSTTLTQTITNPPVSSTPWVTAAERGDPHYGVRFQIPALWLSVPATLGVQGTPSATLDLVANVRLAVGTSPLISECIPGHDCSSDNTFRLDGVPSQHLPPLNVETIELLGAGQTPGSLKPPDQVLAPVRQLFPGGDGMEVWPYSRALDMSVPEGMPASLQALGNKYDACALRGLDVSDCRRGAVQEWTNEHGTFIQRRPSCHCPITLVVAAPGADMTVAVHDYQSSPGGAREAGWFGADNAPLLREREYGPGLRIRPLLYVNDGSAQRGVSGTARVFASALGLAPAGAFTCGHVPDGAEFSDDYFPDRWPPDNHGRLQGTAFGSTYKWSGAAGLFGLQKDPAARVDTDDAPIFDLMSRCGGEINYWLSARNWNKAFQTLIDYDQTLTNPVDGFGSMARVPPNTAAKQRSSVDKGNSTHAASASAAPYANLAVASGLLGPTGGLIVRVTPPHGSQGNLNSTSGPGAPFPSSSVHLRALDAAGQVLSDTGAIVDAVPGAPGASTFQGPVPAAAATVELVRNGVVLDHKQRNHPPQLRLLAPGRKTRARAHGTLLVKWSARDPDGDKLDATVEYSSDGGRSWRTVYAGLRASRAFVPGSFLEGSRRARIRVYVNDGFSDAQATSPLFRADGTPPVAQIIQPNATSSLRAGERTLLSADAFDDHHRALRGGALTWYAGRSRLGTGGQLTARLPAGRITLRLVARDRSGRKTVARRTLQVARPRLRLLQLRYAGRARHRDHAISVSIRTTAAATLRAGGQRYRVGPHARRLLLRLPRRPASGLLVVPFTLSSRTRSASGTQRGTIMVLRR